MSRPVEHLPVLDGLRGGAILLVLAAHSTWLLPQQTSAVARLLGGWLSLGWCGVQLFFVLSGFLITRILLARKDGRTQGRYLADFYTRRALRIFPLYYVALVVLLVLRMWFDLGPVPSEVWWYALYLQNWTNAAGHIPPGMGHFWSLAIEEQFYLAWPIVVWYASRATLARVCVAVVVGVLLVRLVGAYGLFVTPGWLYVATPAQLDGLAMGALVATVDKRVDSRTAWVAIGLGLLAVALLAKVSHSTAVDRITPFAVAVPQAFALTFLGLLLLTLNRPWAVMQWPPLRWVGRVSYGLYVIHYPVAWTLGRMHVVGWGAPLLYLGVTVALALVSWTVLEHPILAQKERLGHHHTTRIVPSAVT